MGCFHETNGERAEENEMLDTALTAALWNVRHNHLRLGRYTACGWDLPRALQQDIHRFDNDVTSARITLVSDTYGHG